MDIHEMSRKVCSIYEENLRVCYYARVSTDHELQMTSIVNQVDYFEKYIEGISCWKFVGGYVDEGISGKNVRKREQFLKMIEDAKSGKFDLILTKSVSRFARNTIDSIKYTDLLLQYGVGVFFLNDNINTIYSDSEFRLTLMASIAQDELRKLSESVQFGLQQSIERGVVLGNDNILGYRKDKGRLVVIPNEANMVKDIFDWFVTGKYNYREVSELLWNKYFKRLDSTGIKRILTNYKYKGYYCGRKSNIVDYKRNKRKYLDEKNWIVYKNHEKVPPIVKEEIWDEVQEIISLRKKKSISKWKVWCVKHERFFLYKRKKYKDRIYGYYVCSDCCSFSEKFLDRMDISGICSQVMVFVRGEDILLMIK